MRAAADLRPRDSNEGNMRVADARRRITKEENAVEGPACSVGLSMRLRSGQSLCKEDGAAVWYGIGEWPGQGPKR